MQHDVPRIQLENPDLEDLLTVLKLRVKITPDVIIIHSDNGHALPVGDKPAPCFTGALSIPNNQASLNAFAALCKMLVVESSFYNQPIIQSNAN